MELMCKWLADIIIIIIIFVADDIIISILKKSKLSHRLVK